MGLLISVKDIASGAFDTLGNTGGGGDNRAGMCYKTPNSECRKTQIGTQSAGGGKSVMDYLTDQICLREESDVGRKKYNYMRAPQPGN
jgi:hypothetical protein